MKVDASRRQSDPRKRNKASVSMVRFRSKSCRRPFGQPREAVVRGRFRVANPPTGECGVKDQVSRCQCQITKGEKIMFEDKVLVCKDCGREFTFTAGEQEFYAEKGFQNEPTRCRECRRGHRNGGERRAPREMFDAVCAECGKPTQVPFVPRTDKPVYCSECFSAHRGQRN